MSDPARPSPPTTSFILDQITEFQQQQIDIVDEYKLQRILKELVDDEELKKAYKDKGDALKKSNAILKEINDRQYKQLDIKKSLKDKPLNAAPEAVQKEYNQLNEEIEKLRKEFKPIDKLTDAACRKHEELLGKKIEQHGVQNTDRKDALEVCYNLVKGGIKHPGLELPEKEKNLALTDELITFTNKAHAALWPLDPKKGRDEAKDSKTWQALEATRNHANENEFTKAEQQMKTALKAFDAEFPKPTKEQTAIKTEMAGMLGKVHNHLKTPTDLKAPPPPQKEKDKEQTLPKKSGQAER